MKSHIVLVDDEELILKSLVREFSSLCESMDITIKTFTSASEAMFFLSHKHNSTFLVISDLRMPEISGSKFLIQINKLYPEIKLFLLTAFSDISDVQEAIKASIHRLILKPWNYEDLQSAITNAYKSYEIEQENRELKKELLHNLEVAGEFQRQLLCNTENIEGSIETDIKYAPSQELHCGGDFYDLTNIDNDKRLIMLGDVSGFSIKSAFVTAMLKVICSMIKPKLYTEKISTSKIISYINHSLFKSLSDIKDIIVTFTVVYIDQKSKKLVVSGAGKQPVYILRKDSLISIKNNNVAMGFIHDYEYNEISKNLKKNDLIIIFTDGLIESEKHKTIVDEEKMKQLLLNLDLSINPAERIYDCFSMLQNKRKFTEDVTLIVTRVI